MYERPKGCYAVFEWLDFEGYNFVDFNEHLYGTSDSRLRSFCNNLKGKASKSHLRKNNNLLVLNNKRVLYRKLQLVKPHYTGRFLLTARKQNIAKPTADVKV